jgi:ABC-2 type transport system ATP-binding protein
MPERDLRPGTAAIGSGAAREDQEGDTEMVAVRQLCLQYGSREALHDITFSVRSGEVFGVLGPNGSGKSTLFRILATLMLPTCGRAEIDGWDVTQELMQVRRLIGVVFQTPSLDQELTVEENLRCQGRMYGIPGRELARRVEATLTFLGMADVRQEKTGRLSGGQQRQIDVAKAILHQPGVLLLDEPSSGLDPGARIDLWQQLGRLRKQFGTTVLLTTHILDEAERCDRLLILHRGRRVAEGTPAELRARVRGDVVVVEAAELEPLRANIAVRFQVQPLVVKERLHLETANGARFMRELLEAFPHAIQSVVVHKPSLEDVFLRETGELMESDDETNRERGRAA